MPETFLASLLRVVGSTTPARDPAITAAALWDVGRLAGTEMPTPENYHWFWGWQDAARKNSMFFVRLCRGRLVRPCSPRRSHTAASCQWHRHIARLNAGSPLTTHGGWP